VIVVALLVSWTLRNGNDTKEYKARNLAALALGLLIAAYLYAHTVSLLGYIDVATTVYSLTEGEDIESCGTTCPE
jgi:hypothetical protein